MRDAILKRSLPVVVAALALYGLAPTLGQVLGGGQGPAPVLLEGFS